MRLIDIDAWKEKNANFFGLGLKLDIDEVVDTLDHMPTIEAIPVSYIQKRADTYYSKAYKNALNTIISDWQEDKEVKNNE